VAFTLGTHMRIDALPGMTIPEEPSTHLGSFWRETAVVREELEWFATGHRLVEALVGLVRDGDAGRSAALRLPGAPPDGALVVRFALELPQPADLSPGARVPSRQASRYLDVTPLLLSAALADGNRPLPDLLARVLGGEGEEGRAALRVPPPGLEAAWLAVEARAEAELAKRRAAALEVLAHHAEVEAARLDEALRGGADAELVEEAREQLQAHHRDTEEALRRARVRLDAAALVVP
jgi:ATP-dependent helicase HepA